MIGIVAAVGVSALVAVGYYLAPPLWRRMPPRARWALQTVGLVLLFALWAGEAYKGLARHHAQLAWLALTIIGVIGMIRTALKTYSNTPTGKGTHA